jgi:hypothetical protein
VRTTKRHERPLPKAQAFKEAQAKAKAEAEEQIYRELAPTAQNKVVWHWVRKVSTLAALRDASSNMYGPDLEAILDFIEAVEARAAR